MTHIGGPRHPHQRKSERHRKQLNQLGRHLEHHRSPRGPQILDHRGKHHQIADALLGPNQNLFASQTLPCPHRRIEVTQRGIKKNRLEPIEIMLPATFQVAHSEKQQSLINRIAEMVGINRRQIKTLAHPIEAMHQAVLRRRLNAHLSLMGRCNINIRHQRFERGLVFPIKRQNARDRGRRHTLGYQAHDRQISHHKELARVVHALQVHQMGRLKHDQFIQRALVGGHRSRQRKHLQTCCAVIDGAQIIGKQAQHHDVVAEFR